ncbi:MAG: hypothetical protein KAT16_08930 [Candidatus Heimdallarchaeota archaeon]|nr:hypothetical protein [Candidatus Heimdallarchaeota archaeon]
MISQTNRSENQIRSFSTAISAIEDEIQHLFDFYDIFAVILFRLDGRVLTSLYNTGFSDSVLPLIKWISNIISKTKEELKRGAKSIKYHKKLDDKKAIPVYFYRAGNSSIVVAILNQTANTGLMEIEMSRTAARLGMIIDTKKALGEC